MDPIAKLCVKILFSIYQEQRDEDLTTMYFKDWLMMRGEIDKTMLEAILQEASYDFW